MSFHTSKVSAFDLFCLMISEFLVDSFIPFRDYKHVKIISHHLTPLLFSLFIRYRRRSRSRSVSHSPRRESHRSRSPLRSRSPREKQQTISDRLKSRLGPRVVDQRSPTWRSASRSRSRDSTTPRSPAAAAAAAPRKHGRKAGSASPNSSRSTSPARQRGLVSYEDLSSTGIN